MYDSDVYLSFIVGLLLPVRLARGVGIRHNKVLGCVIHNEF